MSDPRNVAHAKKVTQEKKHQGAAADSGTAAGQPGKKSAAAKKKSDPAGVAAETPETAAAEPAVPAASPAAPPASLEGALSLLAQLKEMEFYSRANLERLAAMVLSVDELKLKAIASPLDEVYSAQNAFQTGVTTLIEACQAECDRMQGGSV